MNISDRINKLPISATRKLAPYAKKAKADGVKVYHLNIGQPDVDSPPEMMECLKICGLKHIPYAASQGLEEFITSLQKYYTDLGFSTVEENDILTTVGGSEGIFFAIFSICDPGDEILVFEPFYTNYNGIAEMCEVKLVPIETKIETGFHLPEKSEILNKVSERTKVILICTPNNPTGTVYTKEEMRMLADVAKEKGVYLLSDEVYREFTYGNVQHASALDFMDEIPEQIVLLDSLSKRYNLCGARLGVIVTKNKKLFDAMNKLAMSRLSSGYLDQYIGSKLISIDGNYLKKMNREFEERRNVIYEELKDHSGITLATPEGAFYSMVGLPVENAEDFCIWLLENYRSEDNETVMMAPGEGFYATPGKGKNEVRIAYVLNPEDLRKSMQILKAALEEYKSENT